MTEYELKCKWCKNNYKEDGDIPRCNCMCENHNMFEPITNYERIQKMSVEEMVVFLDDLQCNCFSRDCDNCPIHKIEEKPHRACTPRHIKQWLESEVSE